MPPILPPSLTSFIAASNRCDTAAFLDCFADNAMVRDENYTHTGKAEIAAWFEDVGAKYHPTLRPLQVDADAETALLKTEISGTFDGSPIELHYRFTYTAGKIETLSIGD